MSWIKVRTDLPDDPAVFALAATLNISEVHVLGCLVRLWAWADVQTVDGNARGVTEAWLDRYVSVSGFAKALTQVGWLALSGDGLSIPNFERHMGQSAKKRALTANRVALHRERACNASGVTREEKRREEESRSEQPPLTPPAEGKRAGRKRSSRQPYQPRHAESSKLCNHFDACWKVVQPTYEAPASRDIHLRAADFLIDKVGADEVGHLIDFYAARYRPGEDGYDWRPYITGVHYLKVKWPKLESERKKQLGLNGHAHAGVRS